MNHLDTVTLRAGFNHTWIHGNGILGDQRGRTQYIHDAWAKDTLRAMGHAAPHNNFFHLYINGIYWGFYNPTERPSAQFQANYFGGTKDDYDVMNANTLVDGTRDAWRELFAVANPGLADQSSYEAIQQMLDVPQLIDYLMINHYGANRD